MGEDRRFLEAGRENGRKEKVRATISEEPISPKLNGCSGREAGPKEAAEGDAATEGLEKHDEITVENLAAPEEEVTEGDGLSQGTATEIRCEPCGGEVQAEDPGEEGRESKKVRSPTRVSEEEKEMHERTHTPFRQWCKYCYGGEGLTTAIRKRSLMKKEKEEPQKFRGLR